MSAMFRLNPINMIGIKRNTDITDDMVGRDPDAIDLDSANHDPLPPSQQSPDSEGHRN